ncbi:DUF1996 domain-containing protein [Tsuneonella troitsensis]|uniref:DUF1996 domain-containing protein n=1 Tax=Tsuneonella troitsensis TaxID=292222 RepID=UPI000A90136A|nr:DUF1996 domain-containing protein [Tsuneonella troitsensis]
MGSGYVAAQSEAGAPDFLVSFDVSNGLQLAWGTGAIPDLYTPDRSEGAFRFTCGGAGKLRFDDPVLYPGQPGKSHLHQPWGNAAFDAYTTPARLAASAETDCNSTPFSLNRSLYWMPALVYLDNSMAIQPDLVSVYYKRSSKGSPECDPANSRFVGKCVGLPNQIRFIFGWDPARPTAKIRGASWYCTGGTGQHFSNIQDVFASGCKVGDTLIANTMAPDCWDGKHLDTPDHRSHLAYSGWYTQDGLRHCPAGFPFLIPQEENKAMWTVTADMIGADGKSRIGLSSDHMLPGARPGETLHADYIETWDARAKAIWIDNCIDKGLSCSGGDLGNGRQLIGAAQPSYGWINPSARVPIPGT